ncbi:ribonuclease III [Kiritimatiellota bacterium B12222]|nr:ribonuclease III [Kiritimatiellota bacterium B12222]
MNNKEFKIFQKHLGYKFKKRTWLETALTHPSYRHEGDADQLSDNQRLEFLGDAVVGLLSAEYLYAIEPPLDEGSMTKFRSMVTSRSGLSVLALEWDIGPRLRLGKGEAQSGGAERESNLADAVEAVIGAVFQDGGMKACRKLFSRHFEPRLASLLEEKDIQVIKDNPKGSLQEHFQSNYQEAPEYRILSEEGPAHDRMYVAGVFIKDEQIGEGSAPSKRMAEAQAAAQALAELKTASPDT